MMIAVLSAESSDLCVLLFLSGQSSESKHSVLPFYLL